MENRRKISALSCESSNRQTWLVGTKVRLRSEDFGHISNAVTKSLEGSLARLRLERVNIFHLHYAITVAGGGEALSVRQVLDEVVPTL